MFPNFMKHFFEFSFEIWFNFLYNKTKNSTCKQTKRIPCDTSKHANETAAVFNDRHVSVNFSPHDAITVDRREFRQPLSENGISGNTNVESFQKFSAQILSRINKIMQIFWIMTRKARNSKVTFGTNKLIRFTRKFWIFTLALLISKPFELQISCVIIYTKERNSRTLLNENKY